MNIFALSSNPVEAAQQMLDKHVVKMPTESCQMLHTNHLFFAFVDLYGYEPSLKELKQYHKDFNTNLMKPAMLNHPSTIWARENPNNADWLMRHALALCEEYTHRYGKTHGSYSRILQTWDVMGKGCWKEASPVSIAMAEEYRIPNEMQVHNWDYVIRSYRHYYLEGKWRFAEWRKDRRPEWFPENWYAKKYNQEIREFNKRNNANLKLMEE